MKKTIIIILLTIILPSCNRQKEPLIVVWGPEVLILANRVPYQNISGAVLQYREVSKK